MKKINTDKLLETLSIAAYAVMSVTFLLMPSKLPAVYRGILLWSSFLCGTILQVVLNSRRKAYFRRHRASWKKYQKPAWGIVSFGSNTEAKIADVSFAISLVATVMIFAATNGVGYLCFVGAAVTVFTFCLHCIFNGRNYFHINNPPELRKKSERTESSKLEKERE